MTIPNGSRRVAITASLAGGELMVHNFWLRDVVLGGGDLQGATDRIRDAWVNFINTGVGTGTSMATYLSSSTVYADVKVYNIDAATQRTSDLAVATFGTLAGNSGSKLPTEVAIAATLETGKPGRSRRGRVYLGGFGVQALEQGTGRVEVPCRNTIANGLARFFAEGVDQTAAPDDFQFAVMSSATTTINRITRVSCGDVFDVQRRRRNNLVEVRSSALVALPA